MVEVSVQKIFWWLWIAIELNDDQEWVSHATGVTARHADRRLFRKFKKIDRERERVRWLLG